MVLLGQHRDQRAGFASAVALGQDRPEHFDSPLDQRWRHWRCAIHHQAQAAKVIALDPGEIDQTVDHGRHQEQPGHALALDGLEQQLVIVAFQQKVAGTDRQQRHQLHAAGMGDRADVSHDVARGGATGRAGEALAD
ncbi:hypothetical protein D3C79_899440 [compost metagenome]